MSLTPPPAAAVNLATGEVLEHLDQQPAETVAEALALIHAKEAELKQWREPLEADLRRRLKMRGAKLAVFGDWEVEATVKNESEWDAVELEQAMRDLVDEGVIPAADTVDVIVRTPVVSRSKANQLLARLTGDAHQRVGALRTWREKPGRVTVVRSVQLTPPLDIDPQELFAE
jgi:hypothetical protein